MLDHYVPQVHIRRFYSPALGSELLYAIRKTDLKRFTPNSRGVCGINDGSTNPYLLEDRAIEEFLRTIEPGYDMAIEKLETGKVDQQCIYTIAGFVASIISCSPAGMRIHSGPLKSSVEATLKLLEAQGRLPPRPASLIGVPIAAQIDPKYPQALGIEAIKDNTAAFGNCEWEVLISEFKDNPLFTSDFPVAIERSDDPRILNRIVPLAPHLAIRILPKHRPRGAKLDMSFSSFSFRIKGLSLARLALINRRIVQCAENTVLYRDDRAWVEPFVAKNRYFRIEPYARQIREAGGVTIWNGQEIAEKRPATES
jgi:hypothetical protein